MRGAARDIQHLCCVGPFLVSLASRGKTLQQNKLSSIKAEGEHRSGCGPNEPAGSLGAALVIGIELKHRAAARAS